MRFEVVLFIIGAIFVFLVFLLPVLSNIVYHDYQAIKGNLMDSGDNDAIVVPEPSSPIRPADDVVITTEPSKDDSKEPETSPPDEDDYVLCPAGAGLNTAGQMFSTIDEDMSLEEVRCALGDPRSISSRSAFSEAGVAHKEKLYSCKQVWSYKTENLLIYADCNHPDVKRDILYIAQYKNLGISSIKPADYFQ